ncbi:TPA: hypothetical protein I7281_24405 [Vibrio parahaemolyticus]|uniref:hypothetical protein n=1 Tax=Vibrio parahaemolyticus TaxID=670 RepID=UPI001A2C34E0|nr:hypothetical protein [Vibrio parahaemolyticus]
MELELVEKTVLQTLEKLFSCQFEVVRGFRHFEFRGADYDFSFPACFAYESSAQGIERKITRWIQRDRELINPNSHVIYDSNGVIQASSVLSEEVSNK